MLWRGFGYLRIYDPDELLFTHQVPDTKGGPGSRILARFPGVAPCVLVDAPSRLPAATVRSVTLESGAVVLTLAMPRGGPLAEGGSYQ